MAMINRLPERIQNRSSSDSNLALTYVATGMKWAMRPLIGKIPLALAWTTLDAHAAALQRRAAIMAENITSTGAWIQSSRGEST